MRPNPQETADLLTFTEEVLNGKLHFLCSVVSVILEILYLLLSRFFTEAYLKPS